MIKKGGAPGVGLFFYKEFCFEAVFAYILKD